MTDKNPTPNKYALFDPDPSYVPDFSNLDHPLLKPEMPFGDLPKPPPQTEEEHKAFLKEQNKRVTEFWKNKRNN